ncbi:MAG: universal stress protein [Mycobacteriaceae bacterium]|nr:universal stress protein [Mycobacteriaceae bacterium]
MFNSATVPTLVALSAQVEMVGVGYRGHGGMLAGDRLGSVSSALVYHARCPVAVVHDDQTMVGDVERAPLLVGIDGTGIGSVDRHCIRGSLPTRCRSDGVARLDRSLGVRLLGVVPRLQLGRSVIRGRGDPR